MNGEAITPPTPMAPFSGGAQIPRALRREKRWVPWITQWLPKARGGAGKWDKRPGLGKSTAKPDTWLTFADALAEREAHPEQYAGIGYCTTEQTLFVGVDLDHCVTDGVIAAWAQEVVDQLASYTEISPSGRGLRIMVAGHVPNDWNNHEVGIEVYGGNTARFLTITGTHVAGTPSEVCTPPAGSLESLEQRYAKDRAKADVIDLNMPELIDDMLLPSIETLDIPYKAKDFLLDGEMGADRSLTLFSTAVALYAAGLPDAEVFSILANNEHAMGLALDKRRQDYDRALAYLWREDCCKGRAKAVPRITADEFDVIESAPRAPGAPLRFQFVPAHEFVKRQPVHWLIKRVLPQAGLCVVFGESGSGKSFFMLDLVGAIARGVEWRGHKVKQARVAYICAEGVDDFRLRVDAYGKHHGLDLADFQLRTLDAAPNFMQAQDIKDLIEALRALGDLGVVVVDTTACVMPGANENSGEDMGRLVAHCKALHRATGALIILVHHSGKDASRGARGWSGLRAAADAEIEVVRSGDDRAAIVTKLKGGEDGAEYGFKLSTVVVGLDEDDEAISTCVIEHTQAVPEAKRKKEPKGDNERIVLRTLQKAYDLTGEGVLAGDLIDMAANELTRNPDAKQDRRAFVCSRAIDSLKAKNRVEEIDGRLVPV